MKKLISVLAVISMLVCCAVTVSAADKTYTFSGVNIAKPAGTEDVENVKLTNDITVTTGGLMNWKAAAVTDIGHNNDCGFYPIGGNFNPKGSYIYLAVGNSNDGSLYTLNLPKIEKGSEVTLTFAKPVVTNNGSTRRNENDPYAYFKIADRYMSINGGEFDKWQTASVVTGEDTDKIEFYCDQWGAVAIQKIEVKSGKNTELHPLTVKTTQYANLTINGIRFYADENGVLTGPSFEKGEKITVTAKKDGYKDAETTVTVGNGNVTAEVYPECEENAVYYESDFGSLKGTLELDSYNLNVEAKPITRFFGEVSFKENGTMTLTGDKGNILTISKKADGIYAGDTFITAKDNMKFELFLDKDGGFVTLCQNNIMYLIDNISLDFNSLSGLTGNDAIMDYLGVSYPDLANITINAPDTVSYISDYDGYDNYILHDIDFEYLRPGSYYIEDVGSISNLIDIPNVGSFNMKEIGNSSSVLHSDSDTVRIEVEYEGNKVYKDVKLDRKPKLGEIVHTGRTLNLYESKWFNLDSVKDEYGNTIFAPETFLRDFKSSDESVIKIDENGTMTAVGIGKAVITANLYTGVDNPISAQYTVDCYSIEGTTGSDGIAYEPNDFSENKYITDYKMLVLGDDDEYISITDIPAAAAKKDGVVITSTYLASGELRSSKRKNVKAGDKIEISTEKKTVYFYADGKLEKITEPDTTMEGFKINIKPNTGYRISPVYTFTDLGDVSEGKTLGAMFEEEYYDITFKKAETWRGDILVNGYMVGNNVDQADADRKVTDGALYTAERIFVGDGEITVSMTDGSTMLDYVRVEKTSDLSSRIFVIGDSLACAYYGDFDREVGGGRSGWGQQLSDFVNLPITNLANSGQYAKGLYDTAFPGVIKYGAMNDIVLIECGYNDRSYSTREEMTETVKAMVTECRDKGMIPILVTPNASKHDYKESVSWSSYLRDAAADMNCDIIDLSKMSYDFLYSLYGDDKDDVVTKNYNLTEVGGDTLHSSYAGAYVWASMVAQGLKDLGYDLRYDNLINTDFKYTFTDTVGNEITAQVK